MVNETGLDRHKLMINPALAQPSHPLFAHNIDQFFRLGQLFGAVIRSQGVLEIDLVDVFWKQLQGAVRLGVCSSRFVARLFLTLPCHLSSAPFCLVFLMLTAVWSRRFGDIRLHCSLELAVPRPARFALLR
jgi:hypothetical protein